MFKKFFSNVVATFYKYMANITISILPKKQYLKFLRKYDSNGIFQDVPDDVLLMGRIGVRIETAIQATIMVVGTVLGHAIYKKCHA